MVRRTKTTHLGGYIKTLLKDRGVTVKDFCLDYGHHEGQLYRLFRGETSPSLSTIIPILEDLAEECGQDWEDLAFWCMIYARLDLGGRDGK